ncbi:MAG: oxygen-independent coproporphyrinogen III oxidase [Gammaproteobacteria bacterium]
MNDAVFDAGLISRYGGQGPRYTSYPTAVQFGSEFNAADYEREALLSNQDPIPGPLSIYIHIPFCHSLCYYCGCSKLVTRHPERAEFYLQKLLEEVRLQGKLFDKDRKVGQLHMGGGTPTYFDNQQLERLMAGLSESFQLVGDGSQEYSIELDPRTMDAERLHRIADSGFNRISLGVQDFDEQVQKAINRVQPVELTLDLIREAPSTGIESVSVDLIYGLPLQTPDSFSRTLDVMIEARPDRLAIYSYAHMPQLFRAQRLIRSEDLPDPAMRLEILQLIVSRLTAAGYVYIGMDHFALPGDELCLAMKSGCLQRNFQGYSTRAGWDLIGMGSSAISKVGSCFSQHVKSVQQYNQCLDAGRLPVERGLMLSAEDHLRAQLIQRIMCGGRLDYRQLDAEYSIDFRRKFATEIAALEKLDEDGLVELHADYLQVTGKGRFLLRSIAMVFDAYLQHGDNRKRFSKIV